MEYGKIPPKYIEVIVGLILVLLLRKPLDRILLPFEPLTRIYKLFIKVIGVILILLFVILMIYSCFI